MMYTPTSHLWLARIILITGLILGYQPVLAQSPFGSTVPQQSVVRAVMFWMDTCGHCHYVLEEVLPPLYEQYGGQLEITLIEVKTAEDFDRLYLAAQAFNIAKEQVGVPFLVIGDHVLIGSAQIPDELSGLIEHYLAAGGVDYPQVEAFAGLLPTPVTQADEICAPSVPCEETAVEPNTLSASNNSPNSPQSTVAQPVQSDGFALAIVVMVGMIASLVVVVGFIRSSLRQNRARTDIAFDRRWRDMAILLLSLIGLGIAGYLAYVETQVIEAVCGPVGDCNAVQASPYARLFGVLPVGVLGVIGYLMILAAWGFQRLRHDRLGDWAALAMFGIAVFGVLFSLYLTFLEPFVIKAVCIWCISSAVIMTLLLLFSLKPALQAIQRLQEVNRSHTKIEIETPSA